MYIFVLTLFLGLNPNFGDAPTFAFLAKFETATQCENAVDKMREKIEKEEDKKRLGCMALVNKNFIRET